MNEILRAAHLREKVAWYISLFVGKPYVWGGDDPMGGFDCSGLIIEVLKAVGLETSSSDKTADMLWLKYGGNQIASGYVGCLVFWFNAADRAIHVEMMIDNEHTIGASGGGSSTTTIEEASRRNAFVKMRPVGYRGAGFKFVDPFMVKTP